MVRVRDSSLLALLGLVTLSLGVLAACGSDLPTFPPSPRDLGIECTSTDPAPSADAGSVAPRDSGPASDAGPATDGGAGAGRAPLSIGCATGEICLQGHCYEGCGSDADCIASEQCTAGACVVRTVPRADMGPPDLGVPDLCRGVMCGAGTFCLPRTGACVQCLSSDDCGASAPVCDIAFGVCRTFVGGQCAPCRVDVDCTGAVGGFDTRCLERTSPAERVCVARCASDGSCPQGTVCDVDTNDCLPRIGTCTTYFAALQHRGCTIDEECAPLGATTLDFLFPGTCRFGTCTSPCGMPGSNLECADAAQFCDGTFCGP